MARCVKQSYKISGEIVKIERGKCLSIWCCNYYQEYKYISFLHRDPSIITR